MLIYTARLEPSHAGRIARLERRTYPRCRRAGKRRIRKMLAKAEAAGANLSLGLFDRRRLIGCILACRSDDRAELFAGFEVSSSAMGRLHGGCVYVEDFILEPSVGRHGIVLMERWAAEVRRRAPGLPIDAFCLPETVARWEKHRRGFRHAGFEQRPAVEVTDLTGDDPWRWVTWDHLPDERLPSPGVHGRCGIPIPGCDAPTGTELRIVRSVPQWRALRREWERLHERTADADAFSAFEWLYEWWRQRGGCRRLAIVILYRDGRLAGIAPLMISVCTQLLRHVRQLAYIGDPALTERPKFLVEAGDTQAERLLWQGILALRDQWDLAALHEQTLDRPAPEVAAALRGRGLRLARAALSKAPYVARQGSDWKTYLAGRGKSLRKNLKRKFARMGNAWAVTVSEGDACPQALDDYIALERRSWKAAVPDGLCNKPDAIEHYRQLLAAGDGSLRFRFMFLELDGRKIAGTFGVACQGRYSSLEICHDEALGAYSPGVLLTACELEAWFGNGAGEEYDFLLGSPENKVEWATAVRITRDLWLLPAGWYGNAVGAWLLHVRPAIKAFLKKIGVFDSLYRRMKPVPAADGAVQ